MANIFDTIRDNGLTPTAIDAEDYWYALEVLPPIYAKGCFGISEQYSFNAKGQPTYYWFTSRGGSNVSPETFYGLLGTRAEAENVFSAIPSTPKGAFETV